MPGMPPSVLHSALCRLSKQCQSPVRQEESVSLQTAVYTDHTSAPVHGPLIWGPIVAAFTGPVLKLQGNLRERRSVLLEQVCIQAPHSQHLTPC